MKAQVAQGFKNFLLLTVMCTGALIGGVALRAAVIPADAYAEDDDCNQMQCTEIRDYQDPSKEPRKECQDAHATNAKCKPKGTNDCQTLSCS